MKFEELVRKINQVHETLQFQAVNAVNKALTIRNWLIGYYIVEFEQKGEMRAKYGTQLLQKLEKKFKNIKGFDERAFRNFRSFFLNYPQIFDALPAHSENFPAENFPAAIRGSLNPTLPVKSIRGSLNPESSSSKIRVNGSLILSKLSYTHLEQLIKISDPLKRTFYEMECMKGIWSVRELKRQINALYYERTGLSAKPRKLAEMVRKKVTPQASTDIIKNIYAFEFLDLNIKDVVEESDLEKALLDHLQEFITELGNGFCLENRQKRIFIGEKYYFIDLVFYHRILKCHVLIDLKIGEFSHEDIGQLNTYLNYYKKEIAETNDKHPVGILLVAEKDHALVKYATAGMDKNLFIQQYLVQLPSAKVLEDCISKELKKLS